MQFHDPLPSIRYLFDAKFAQVCTIGEFHDKIRRYTKHNVEDTGSR